MLPDYEAALIELSVDCLVIEYLKFLAEHFRGREVKARERICPIFCDYHRLLLFFSGWGAEPSMFADNTGTRGTYDILMLWDYRDTAFDAKVLDGYTEVRFL